LREEKDMFMRSQDNNNASSGGYWDEYSDASESSIERRRDPKHNRRTTIRKREESHMKSISNTHQMRKRTLCKNHQKQHCSSTGVPTNHTTKA
jgi:hypothetical protein